MAREVCFGGFPSRQGILGKVTQRKTKCSWQNPSKPPVIQRNMSRLLRGTSSSSAPSPHTPSRQTSATPTQSTSLFLSTPLLVHQSWVLHYRCNGHCCFFYTSCSISRLAPLRSQSFSFLLHHTSSLLRMPLYSRPSVSPTLEPLDHLCQPESALQNTLMSFRRAMRSRCPGQFRIVLTTDLSSSRPSIPGYGCALTLNVALAWYRMHNFMNICCSGRRRNIALLKQDIECSEHHV